MNSPSDRCCHGQVNNAALFSLSHAYDKALESMNINYFGTMNLTETLLPLFKEGGRIINISSIAGFLSVSHLVHAH